MTLQLATALYFGLGIAVFWLRRTQGHADFDALLAALFWPLDYMVHWMRAILERNLPNYLQMDANTQDI